MRLHALSRLREESLTTDLVRGIRQPARAERKGHCCAGRRPLAVQQLARAGRRIGHHTEHALQGVCIKSHYLQHESLTLRFTSSCNALRRMLGCNKDVEDSPSKLCPDP